MLTKDQTKTQRTPWWQDRQHNVASKTNLHTQITIRDWLDGSGTKNVGVERRNRYCSLFVSLDDVRPILVVFRKRIRKCFSFSDSDKTAPIGLPKTPFPRVDFCKSPLLRVLSRNSSSVLEASESASWTDCYAIARDKQRSSHALQWWQSTMSDKVTAAVAVHLWWK